MKAPLFYHDCVDNQEITIHFPKMENNGKRKDRLMSHHGPEHQRGGNFPHPQSIQTESLPFHLAPPFPHYPRTIVPHAHFHCPGPPLPLQSGSMSDYFLKLPGDSQPRSYSEYEVREFLGQGVIDSTTLVWKPGMDGWQPVKQVLPETPLKPNVSREEEKGIPSSVPVYRLRYSLSGLAKLSILACIVLLPCMLWSGWIVLSNDATSYEEIQTAIQQNLAQLPPAVSPLALLLCVLFIPSVLIQLIWLYRACANVREFQIQGLRFTPFLSVILSCMPMVGMVLNALILQELYKASKNPAEWMLQSPSVALRLYLLTTTVLTLCALFPFGSEHLLAFLLFGVLTTATTVLWLVSVLQITKKQQELASEKPEERS